MDKVLVFCVLLVCLGFSNYSQALDEEGTKSSIVQSPENSPWDPREEAPTNIVTEGTEPNPNTGV